MKKIITTLCIFLISFSAFSAKGGGDTNADLVTPFQFYYQWDLVDIVQTGFSQADQQTLTSYINLLESNKYAANWDSLGTQPRPIGNVDSNPIRLASDVENPLQASLPGQAPYYFWGAARTLSNFVLTVEPSPLAYEAGPGNTKILPYKLTVTDVLNTGTRTLEVGYPGAAPLADNDKILSRKTSGLFWSYLCQMEIVADVETAWAQTYRGTVTMTLTVEE